MERLKADSATDDRSSALTRKPRNRRRLSLSLRMMMVIVLLVGVVVAYNVNKARRVRRAIQTVERFGGEVDFDFGKPAANKTMSSLLRWPPDWLRRQLGNEYFYDIDTVYASSGKWTNEATKELRSFPRLKEFYVYYLTGNENVAKELRVGDDSMEILASLPELEKVVLFFASSAETVGVFRLGESSKVV